MKSWDELSSLEQLQCTFSDLYKDVYGFRPRSIYTERQWNSEKILNMEMNRLSLLLAEKEKKVEELQKESIDLIEKQIKKIIMAGANNRETAIQWILEGADCSNDPDFYCYKNGLPYGYFNHS